MQERKAPQGPTLEWQPMAVHDDPTLSTVPDDPSAWPIVSPSDIGIPDFHCDLAYMGVNVRLQICNRSPYLVREAELRVDGKAPGSGRVVTSRYVRVGPLFPGAYVEEEVGIGAQGGISGLKFETLAARAVRLIPPSEMVPASQYAGLLAEIIDVTVDENAPDPRDRWDEQARAVATKIRIRVRNAGQAVVEIARLKLRYFEVAGSSAGGPLSELPDPIAEWILDMPRSDWDPYRLPPAPHAFCDPADPLRPDQTHEFTLTHFDGGPREWPGRRDALAVEVCELKLGACYHATP